MVGLLAVLACGEEEPCADGFGRAADGNCYPLATPSGDDDDDDDDTTRRHSGWWWWESGTYGGCDTTFTGPLLVAGARITCAGYDGVHYEVLTEGWSSGGKVYQLDSASAQPWADEHDLSSFAYDPCGAWDALGLDLQTGAAPADWARNDATVFTCADHFEGPGVMTYAVAVQDLYGELADCLAWGDDPQGVIDGSALSPYNYETGPSFDPSICVIGVPAR